jgi:hypothetical protein
MLIRENTKAGNFLILSKVTAYMADKDVRQERADRLIAHNAGNLVAAGHIHVKKGSYDFFIRVSRDFLERGGVELLSR